MITLKWARVALALYCCVVVTAPPMPSYYGFAVNTVGFLVTGFSTADLIKDLNKHQKSPTKASIWKNVHLVYTRMLVQLDTLYIFSKPTDPEHQFVLIRTLLTASSFTRLYSICSSSATFCQSLVNTYSITISQTRYNSDSLDNQCQYTATIP